MGVNVAGYFDSHLGIGEAARQVRQALEAAGVPTAAITLPERRSDSAPPPPPSEPPFPTTLMCVNADALEGAWAWLGPAFARERTVGMWWWEVELFPDRWRRAFDGLDEVWVGSRFVADAVAPVSPVPVVTMPLPLTAREPAALTRAELGLPDGFLFLFTFDFASGFGRKNPLGTIDAFSRAFAPGSGAKLAIKHIGGDEHPRDRALMEEAAWAHPDVHLVGDHLPADRQAALTQACDCYVSLHRSEGFGLTIAEAVLAGKPVVATAYSGPLDFLGPSSAYLVDHELRPVGEGHDPYPSNARWAEPDLDHAARVMSEVYGDQDGARARAQLARDRLERSHSPAAAGEAMARRLAWSAGVPGASARTMDMSELDRRIAGGPPLPAAARRNPLRRGLRGLMLRVMRPQISHQRRVDEELARSLRTLDERVQGLAEVQATLQTELREHGDGPAGAGRDLPGPL